MRDLQSAIAARMEGFSVNRDIIDRAVLMRDHARFGNFRRAEEYAVEIEALQVATYAHDNSLGGLRQEPYWRDWPIGKTNTEWAAKIIGGATMMHRRIHPACVASLSIAAE